MSILFSVMGSCLSVIVVVTSQIQACHVWGFSEKLLTKEDAGLYDFINQGCLGVDGMDDKEEMRLTDVCTVKVPL